MLPPRVTVPAVPAEPPPKVALSLAAQFALAAPVHQPADPVVQVPPPSVMVPPGVVVQVRFAATTVCTCARRRTAAASVSRKAIRGVDFAIIRGSGVKVT